MRDEYTITFRKVIQETLDETGYTIPDDIELYITELLAYFIDKSDFLPRTFAEELYKIDKRSGFTAKELGDTCLFVTGVFPSYGKKYGLNKSYYKNIGKASYDQASKILNYSLFSSLCMHYDFLESFITRVTSKPIPIIRIG